MLADYNKDQKSHNKDFKELRPKASIKQVKVMRDQDKHHLDENGQMQKLASGLAFCEFEEHGLAMFAVRYLNNLRLSGARGLIVDFALEDARKMFKRKQKIEKFAKIAEEKRKEARN